MPSYLIDGINRSNPIRNQDIRDIQNLYRGLRKSSSSSSWRLDTRRIQNLYRRLRKSFSTPGLPHPPSFSSPSQDHDVPPIPSAPSPLRSIWDSDSGLSNKVRGACEAARRDGFRYLWIDSCCIDKTSSSELSESINSMFAWYRDAMVCYAFLSDVPTSSASLLQLEDSPFRSSVWFIRAWTLQELIAPAKLVFFSQTWELLGTKASLAELIEEITSIPVSVLTGYGGGSQQSLDECSVAQRMSWAAHRRATKVEDEAYSLLGIFDIQMPTLYGEGERAFRRLQEEILRRIPDQTIFAWGPIYPSTFPELVTSNIDNHLNEIDTIPEDLPTNELRQRYMFDTGGVSRSILAHSPRNFGGAGKVISVPHDHFIDLLTRYWPISPQEYTSTPHGIRTSLPLLPLATCLSPSEAIFEVKDAQRVRWYLAVLACEQSDLPGQLLARTCHIAAPERPVNLLHCGSLRLCTSLSAFMEGTRTRFEMPFSFDIVRLAVDPRNEPWLVQLRVHTVFLDHPSRAKRLTAQTIQYERVGDSDSESDSREPQTAVFMLPTWCQDALSAQGYTASLEEPRGGGRGMCRLVLAREPALLNESESDPCRCQWSIAADFSYYVHLGPAVFGLGGRRILAAVRVHYISGANSGNRLKEVGDTKELEWTHRLRFSPGLSFPWGWNCSLMSERLEFKAARDRDDSDTITLELGVQLASTFCYQIHVRIISDPTR